MARRFAILAAILCVSQIGGAEADEPAQAFLDGLRERNYFDTALEFLSKAEKDPAVSATFKEMILYERGETLVRGAALERDMTAREQQLDEAQKTLREFIKAKPENLYAVSARRQLGNVIVERAHSRVERAKKLPAAEQAALLKQAREYYDEAHKLVSGVVEELRTKLKTYPAALDEKTDAKRIEERDRYRQDFLLAQLLATKTREDIAETLPKGSKEWTQTLTVAAEAYKKIYEDYRTRIAGLYARMYQGQCLQKLGKHKEASVFFNELLTQADSPDAFRVLKLRTMPLAVDSWMAQKLYPEIMDRPVKMVESARLSDERDFSDELMKIRLAVATASKAYADQLKAKNPKDAEIRRLTKTGREFANKVSKAGDSEQKKEAQKLLVAFGSAEVETVGNRPQPKTFAEAKTAATEAMDAVQQANLVIKALSGPGTKADKETQGRLAENKQQAAKSQADAMQYCRLALKLADSETDLNDLNLVRYLLVWLLYGEKNYYDAVVIGDFLARHYPESQGARQSARIALASYQGLYGQAEENDREFETQQVQSMADYILKKWPGSAEADEALGTLIVFMIRAKKLDQAIGYLEKIPTDSAQRGEAELKTGQALWASYLENSKRLRELQAGTQPPPEGVDLEAQRTELEELKNKAKQTLSDGVERMRKSGELSRVLATAVLSLAQLYVDTSEAGKAVSLLEDKKIGVLTLVEKNDPVAQDDAVAEETYKTALRAYISALGGSGTDVKQTIEKARKIMDSLKKRMASAPQGPQRLVSIYVSLAQDLKRQMEIAEPAAKGAMGEGFETFLKEVASDATELNTLNWVGDTYLAMGEALGTNLKTMTPQGKGYFTKSAEIYQRILDKGKSDTAFLPPQTATAIRIKLAKAKKYTGDYIAARDLLEAILKVSPMVLPAQVEAARLYQDWGGTGKGQEGHYLDAIVGARPDKAKAGKNTIWGWGEIARITANNQQFREQFYDARYNLAICRYQFALTQQDSAKKKEQLSRAKSDIVVTAGLYPDLGGEEMKKKFDSLLRNIQKALGEPAEGLRSLKTPATATVPAKAKTTPVSTSAPSTK
jgi:hypothetical protein